MLGNKEIMAINIKYYMELKQVNSSEVCRALGFKQNTFSNWINAKIYPRIDKIELMANYFGVTKADLVEERREIMPLEKMNIAYRQAGKDAKLFPLTPFERDLIQAFRNANRTTQDNICKLLDIKKDSESLKEA